MSPKKAARADPAAMVQWAAVDDEAGSEATHKRGNKASAITLAAGKDSEGNDLPLDCADPWTKQQRQAFLNNLPRLPAPLQEAWKQACDSSDKTKQRQLVNSIIPPGTTSQAIKLDMGSCDVEKWSHTLVSVKTNKNKSKETGISRTQILGQVYGNTKQERVESLEEGIATGDIIERDGLYWWRSVEKSKEKSKSEMLTYQGESTFKDQAEIGKFMEVMDAFHLADDSDTKAAPGAASSSKGSGPMDAEQMRRNLQECSDACESVKRSLHTLIREVRGMDSSKAGAAGPALVAEGLKNLKDVQSTLDIFDKIFFSDPPAKTDDIVRALQKCCGPFEAAEKAEQDLKDWLRMKKLQDNPLKKTPSRKNDGASQQTDDGNGIEDDLEDYGEEAESQGSVFKRPSKKIKQ